MRETPQTSNSINSQSPSSEIEAGSRSPNVIVCFGNELPDEKLLTPAKQVAAALGGSLVLAQTIEPPNQNRQPYDPVAWDLQKRDARSSLTNFANRVGDGTGSVRTELLEGYMVDQICSCISKRPQDITALFRKPATTGWEAGDPARGVMEADIGSVLMIPMDLQIWPHYSYRRIFVPLDGSSRGETAIPKAIRLAKANHAELVLCHIPPAPGVSRIGHTDAEAAAMSAKITKNNQRKGQEYLNRLETRMLDCGVRVSTRVSTNGDARRTLLKMVEDHQADLIVLASHGESNHPDVPAGDTANFIISRSPVPVLMVRQPGKTDETHVYSDVKSKGVRQTTATMQ